MKSDTSCPHTTSGLTDLLLLVACIFEALLIFCFQADARSITVHHAGDQEMLFLCCTASNALLAITAGQSFSEPASETLSLCSCVFHKVGAPLSIRNGSWNVTICRASHLGRLQHYESCTPVVHVWKEI